MPTAPKWRRFTGLMVIAVLVLAGALYAAAVGTAVESSLELAKTGTVLDARNGQPIEGALVVESWHQEITSPFLIGHGGSVAGGCVHIVVARTDNQGRYSIPSVTGSFPIERNVRPDRHVRYFWTLYAYADGYGIPEQKVGDELRPIFEEHPRLAGASSAEELVPIYLAQEEGSPAERVANLTQALGKFACRPATAVSSDVASGIYGRAYKAACTPEASDGALSLVTLRREVTSSIGPLTTPVEIEVDAIAARNGRMAKTPILEDDKRRLCELLAPG